MIFTSQVILLSELLVVWFLMVPMFKKSLHYPIYISSASSVQEKFALSALRHRSSWWSHWR